MLPCLVSQAVLQQQNQQLRAVQEESELQRQKLQEEVAGYREQSKQHSLTILALEDRLLEATQQQKMLEEEKAALVEKMEGFQCDAHSSTSGTWLKICPAVESHVCVKATGVANPTPQGDPRRPKGRKLQEELAVVQGTLLEKKAVISRLSRELSETRTRMSDMRGELSEEQKVELEHSQRQLQHREWEMNQLREKLSEMSSLVEEKDRALKAAAEELRYTLTSPKASRMPRCAVKSNSEPLVVQMKDLPEEIVQQRGLELEPASVLGQKLKPGKVEGSLWFIMPVTLFLTRFLMGACSGSPTATVSLEMAEATDLGEKMYLDVIGALGSLVEMKEPSGMQPLHLPQERRAEVELQRQKALELLYKKIRNLQVHLERKEEVLKDYGGSVGQLRQNQASLRRCQEEMCRLENETHREAEEKALLQEALERMQLQLDQEKRLQQVAKRHKVRREHPTRALCATASSTCWEPSTEWSVGPSQEAAGSRPPAFSRSIVAASLDEVGGGADTCSNGLEPQRLYSGKPKAKECVADAVKSGSS
ncbi:hypothetical protein DV515_00013540 [Chloebia gouldiae]|uniref:Uncharacterized protein n=1 Tax=Chloebia gouldiae TaxID=44316 RepID=A0A3L8S0W7_CHLGU|nr:hypothetical protein DV515_00013540 [Chloebia gouldiae]